MIDLDKVSEGIHYELVPVEDNPNEQAWHVRILVGQFTETVVSFGNVALYEDNQHLSFNFDVISSPDTDLTVDNQDLQDYVALILENVLERAIADGSLVYDTERNKSRV